jgi:hypothetical protein
VAERLRHAGGEVFVIDLHSADAKADLSAEAGRETAAAAVETRYPGGGSTASCAAPESARPPTKAR